MMKLTVGLHGGVNYICSVSKEVTLADLIHDLNATGWINLTYVAVKEVDVLFLQLEPETVDEFLDGVRGFEYNDNFYFEKGDDEE